MTKVLNGFYAFTAQAKEQPAKGFDFNPIDIIKEIDNLSQKKYANDFEFTVCVFTFSRNKEIFNLNFILP